MKIIMASGNMHKVEEVQSYLSDLGIEVLPLTALLSHYEAPEETGETLEENAKIKAEALQSLLPGEWILADDSGLFVDALGGEPGVHSARYAGDNATDEKNNQKLIRELEKKSRTAAFRSVLCLLDDKGDHFFQGEISGTMLEEPRGNGGFGYDPYFLPLGKKETFAEMSMKDKNKISHRALALKELKKYLQNRL
ncbi:MAG: RdgB/HAM1 family non-canonical purine NTP pyrophosphatase [Tissierellia bacterium]|nr:RdgB/HAM1 family non-canonical purine NTP pyrophosphatase [Tissierellia bacterium]